MTPRTKKSLDGFEDLDGRELYSWGDGVCICGHSEPAHRKKCLGLTGNNFERDCKCKKYRPKDNLLFLEKEYKDSLENEGRY